MFKKTREEYQKKLNLIQKSKSIILTTTNNIDGYNVVEYIDVIGEEVVLGTGFFSEFGAGMADTFGLRAGKFEQKLSKSKAIAFGKLKFTAYNLGADAVIGIDIDYAEFDRNQTGVIVNGTAVRLEKKNL